MPEPVTDLVADQAGTIYVQVRYAVCNNRRHPDGCIRHLTPTACA